MPITPFRASPAPSTRGRPGGAATLKATLTAALTATLTAAAVLMPATPAVAAESSPAAPRGAGLVAATPAPGVPTPGAPAAPAAASVAMRAPRPAAPGTPALPASLAAAIRRAGLAADGVSIYVQRVDEALPRLDLHGEQPMNPASTAKLVTTWSGLRLLGPDWRWKTNFYVDTPPVDGVVRGRLYIRGTGDPKLVPEEMNKIAQALRARGVHTIDATVVLDKSEFVTLPTEEGTIDGEVLRAYNVTPDPLLYAFKVLSFTLEARAGKVEITPNPPLAQLRIDNRLRVGAGSCHDWRQHARIERQPDGSLLASFAGTFGRRCGEQAMTLAVLDHNEFFWGGFVSAWLAAGGRLEGTPQLAVGRVPSHAQLLLSHDSPPLSEIIRDINKRSNNVMARQLFLTIGARVGGIPSNAVTTAQTLKRWLSSQLLDFPELQLENGAGLSREGRISARSLARILVRATQTPDAEIFADSLPIVGVDGTMRHRLVNTAVAGHARIKTGTLDGVRAVAGYVTDHAGNRFVVVSLINDQRSAAAQAVHDRLLEWVYAGASGDLILTGGAKQAAKPAPKRAPKRRVTERANTVALSAPAGDAAP